MKRAAIALVAFGVLTVPAYGAPVTVTGGFTSFSGNVGSGEFESRINGGVVCPTAGCGTGVGPASLSFSPSVSSVDFRDSDNGAPETPNLLSFTPEAIQDVSFGQEFRLGTFTFANGDWFGNAAFGFTLATSSGDPALNAILTDTIELTVTHGLLGTPAQNADFISLGNHPNLGSLRVYEQFDSPTGTNVGSAVLFGRIDGLELTRLGDPTGAAFLNSSVNPQLATTPLPGAAWLLLTALGVLGLCASRLRLSSVKFTAAC